MGFLALGFSAFVAFGVVLVLVGANQAELARSLDMDLSRSGLLGAALALGAGVGVTGAGPIVDRLPRRPLFVGSLLVAAAALLTIDADARFARAFVHVLVLGAGAGFYDTLLNAVAIQPDAARTPAQLARRLAFLHAGATVGAVAGPPLVAWLASRAAPGEPVWVASFHATGVAMLGLALWAALVPLPPPRGGPAPAAEAADAPRSLVSLSLLALALVGFAYVGVETALTVFAVPWAGAHGLPPERGQLAISALWLGLLAGRIGMLLAGRSLGTRFLVACGGGGAAVLGVALALDSARIELVMALAGVTLGAVYPVMIGLAGERFPTASGTAAGIVAGAGAFGGFALPWLAGAVGDAAGLAAGLSTVALCTLVIAFAALALRRREGTRARALRLGSASAPR